MWHNAVSWFETWGGYLFLAVVTFHYGIIRHEQNCEIKRGSDKTGTFKELWQYRSIYLCGVPIFKHRRMQERKTY